nr:MAG TPA_asm: hypothetical protein [Bacteriophage sp.]
MILLQFVISIMPKTSISSMVPYSICLFEHVLIKRHRAFRRRYASVRRSHKSLSGFALKPENLSANKGMVYAVFNPHTGGNFRIKNCQKLVTQHSNRQIL